jgi:hypothetical protein
LHRSTLFIFHKRLIKNAPDNKKQLHPRPKTRTFEKLQGVCVIFCSTLGPLDLAKNNWGGTALISIIQRRGQSPASAVTSVARLQIAWLQVRNALGRWCAPVLIGRAAARCSSS